MADAPDDRAIVPDTTVQDLNKLLQQAKGLRGRFEPTWFLNLAYYMGDQWVFFNRGRLDRPRLDPWRITLTDNRIIGVVRTELAKMTKQKPTWQVIPVSASDGDLEAGRTGERILDYLWRSMAMRRKLVDALLWSRVAGAGFWKITWDSSAGKKVDVAVSAETGALAIHPGTGGPMLASSFGDTMPRDLATRSVAIGDVCVETIAPFDLYPDPIAKELADCEWVIQETVHSSEYVRQHFGVSISPDTDVASGPSESRMFPSWQMGGTSGYRGVKLREYWCVPNSQHPQGRWAVWAKGQILAEGPNPYGCLPYVMFKGLEVPGRFWPTSLVEQLRGPQTELNKIKSQIAENAARLGNPALLVSKQSNVSYSGVPGERIDYDDTTPNAIPTYLKPPEMPGYVLQQQDRIEASFEAISGQHEVTNAQVPAGVTAASAINLLLEADDTRLGPSIYDMEETLADAGSRLLQLVAKYWTDERTILIAGDDHAWDVMQFRGAALKENTHVEVQAGSAFPQSKAARQAAIQQMLQLVIQNNIPVPPSQLREVLRDMESGGLEKFFDDISVDEAQVNRENSRLAQGEMLDVNSFDNHMLHIQVHGNLQKSAQYPLFPPQTQQQIEAHVAQHRIEVMRALQPAGLPGGGPATSPPPQQAQEQFAPPVGEPPVAAESTAPEE